MGGAPVPGAFHPSSIPGAALHHGNSPQASPLPPQIPLQDPTELWGKDVGPTCHRGIASAGKAKASPVCLLQAGSRQGQAGLACPALPDFRDCSEPALARSHP